MRRFIVVIALALASLGTLAASAVAAPVWNLELHHNETHFPAGGTGQYWVDVANMSNDPSSGPVSVTLRLPGGIKGKLAKKSPWSCPGVAGASTIVCTFSEPIARHTVESSLVVAVDIAPETSGVRFATAEVSGGGAAKKATAFEATEVNPEPAEFGIVEGSFRSDFYEADGLTTVRGAGTHPELFVTAFDFNSISSPTATKPEQKLAAESIRDLQVDLPPGFYGNPTAVGECAPAELSFAECPRSSQVGRIDLRIFPIGSEESQSLSVGVFNMVHPRGSIADLAFTFTGIPVHIEASLDPARRYTIRTTVSDINESLPPFHQKLTIWGVPASESHDSERCHLPGGEKLQTSSLCPTDAQKRPFLTAPFDCEAANSVRLHHYDSWQDTGDFGPDVEYPLPEPTTACDAPRFDPEVDLQPTGKQANTPTGLDVHIKVPQVDSPDAPSTPPVKRIEVTLPEGMSFSPSFADGLKACSLAQMKLGTDEPIGCPDASRIGEVELSTPLLPKSLTGSMYLAAQGDNPFDSLFAVYLVLQDTEERGVLVKIPGRIDVDSSTGQISTVFDETPQFPFDDLILKFRSGPRAPLVSPPTCGTHTIGVEVTSWAQPQVRLDRSNAYEITEGPNGSPCQSDPAARPFAPRMSAGTDNPAAGTYSPFGLWLTREDSEQELAGIKTTLPPGLVARIAGVPYCPEQAITSISSAELTARNEQANPACPISSQIGTISAGLGAGPGPNYFGGKVYLAGPYKGAKLSLVVVAPGIAGPFDLGSVVVRVAVQVDPETAQVTAVSDPFPTILHGVVLRVRDVRFTIDRSNTTINPTNCSRMSIDGEVGSASGAIFTAHSPFQASDCGALPFRPKLDLRLFGGTKRGAHPKLRATLTMPPGGANISSASVALPRSEFLDQGHIKTICTRVQFAAEACPAGSIYGTVEATTPLLDETLTGNIYLRSSSHKLPDLVAAFRGGRIDANVVGRIDSVNGGIRNTFDFVPDVPVTKATFTFQGGDKGLLVNSRNICAGTFKATAKFNAQSGASKDWRPKMQAKCGKAGKAKKRQRRRR